MAVRYILSLQLYSLRFVGDTKKELDAAAAAGLTLVEIIQSHLDDAKRFRAMLDDYGLSAPSGHVSLDTLTNRLDWVVEGCKTIGVTYLYMPAVANEDRGQDAAGWARTGATLAGAAETLKAQGIELGYHNHDWELRALADGRLPLDVLFDNAPGVGWQADVAWLVRGGAEPLSWLERYRDRLTSVHVKDIAPQGENLDEDGWCDVGKGSMNWQNLWGQCLAFSPKLMVLEHDKPKDGPLFVKNSASFLQSL